MIGKSVSHYHILEKLGEGGMGVVYKAEDTKLKRTVALKFVHPNLTRDEKAKQRFIQEARAASSLDHTNICTIHEIDETENGQMFIAMGYYEGETLKDRMARAEKNGSSSLPIDEVIRIASQIAEGLARTHEAGIVHRDIKPANIVITDRGEVKILDYGLAKLAGHPQLVGGGSTLGTVAYVAPEQSESEETDERADIWALGVILYEMLTGQQPFRGEADQVILYVIVNEEPAPVRTLRPEVPEELEAIVSKALAKEPDKRYHHVEKLLTALRRCRTFLAKEDLSVDQSAAQRPTALANRRWLSVGGLILILAALFFYLLGPLAQRPRPVTKLAILPFQNLGSPDDQYFTDGMTEEIANSIGHIRNLVQGFINMFTFGFGFFIFPSKNGGVIMPAKSQRAKLYLTDEQDEFLTRITQSRTAPQREVERAKILLKYAEGLSISAIGSCLGVSRPTIYKCIDKALAMGVKAGLKDKYHSPKKPVITEESKAWVVNVACTKPTEHGYAAEVWSLRLLAKHTRKHAPEAGHGCLAQAAKATIQRILKSYPIQPHKIRYFTQDRDPEFEQKMNDVLVVYKEVNLQNEQSPEQKDLPVITVSIDEKPGIQAMTNVRPDLPPVPGKRAYIARDSHYQRLGTLSLLAALDLHTGHVIAQVHDRHRSREFISLLQEVDQFYPKDCVIRVVLDNHSAHISKETMAYLATRPNRFIYVHTPKHGSWLNLIETLFSKMARTFLKKIRVQSIEELQERILKGVKEINEEPVVHRWKKFNFANASLV